MKTASTELRLLIEGGQFAVADLYTITLIDDVEKYITTADIDLKWGGNTFSHTLLPLRRESVNQALGLEVDSMDLSVFPDPNAPFIEDNTFGKCVRLGLLDGATVKLERAYLPDWNSPITGVLHRFEGRVSDIEGGDNEYSVPVKSLLELLNMKMPLNLYQAPCRHTVYTTPCGVDRSAFIVEGEITGLIDLNSFNTDLTAADHYFDLGVIELESGPNSGFRRTVKAYLNASGKVEFSLPLPIAPTLGDTFIIYPGCNRTMEVCSDKFDNLLSYKGYPWVPKPELIY